MAPNGTTSWPRGRVLFLVATLACSAVGCAAVDRASADASACDASERRISTLIRNWYSLLESQAPESAAIEHFLADSPFEFSLTAGEDPGPGEALAWVSELRSGHPQVEYRLQPIRTESGGEGLVRARFEFERRAMDAEGLLHVARRAHTWLIRDVAGASPAVVRIDEERLLSFPGTGPQIVCY
jgi:hypothetical protein